MFNKMVCENDVYDENIIRNNVDKIIIFYKIYFEINKSN